MGQKVCKFRSLCRRRVSGGKKVGIELVATDLVTVNSNSGDDETSEIETLEDLVRSKFLDVLESARGKQCDQVLEEKGFTRVSLIGQGGFSKVYSVKTGDKKLALKIIPFNDRMSRIKSTSLEVDILKSSRHPNIVGLVDYFVLDVKCMYIVMEYANRRTLYDHVFRTGSHFMWESKAKRWFVDILKALHYLHSTLGMAHRDLKLQNVLLFKNSRTSHRTICKLADFGLACVAYTQEDGVIMNHESVGTPAYLPPELLEQSLSSFTPKNGYDRMMGDVWGLAVLLFVMSNKKFPFRGKNCTKLYNAQRKGRVRLRENMDYSPEYMQLLVQMLQVKVDRRIRLFKIFASDWVSSLNDNETATRCDRSKSTFLCL